ncbi:MAG: two component transcriptional regulator, LytTR family [Firmicutes bacterium]|nr:two component transcriptional regulator, LytTR family [Bacillota bacterium]
MHIAVCDDSLVELSRISSLLEDYRREREGSVTYESFHSALELLEAMKARRFDILILDILMPGLSGMEAAREIRLSDRELPIIFLTSSREFAVESYRVGAEDYIIKPARKDEVFPTLDKQLTRFTQEESYLTLKTGSGIVKLLFSQIVYVEVTNRTLQFILVNGEVREAYGYLGDYEDKLLSDPCFTKPHRSYLINLRQVIELDKNGLATTVGKTVPVARDAFVKVKAAYMGFLLSPTERRDRL